MLMMHNNTKSPRVPQQRSQCRHTCVSTGDILPGWRPLCRVLEERLGNMCDSQSLCLLVMTETAEMNTRLESSKEKRSTSADLRSGR